MRQLETVKRLDVVWDIYVSHSLKAATRKRRGSGIRRRVMPSARIPGNWKGFLCVSENKEELFNLLAQKIAGMNVHGKILLSTQSQSDERSWEDPLEHAVTICVVFTSID
ncbi:hypothetical protein ACOMHN_012618 [Nucella lapillus]